MNEQEGPVVRTCIRVPGIRAAAENAARLGAEFAPDHMEDPGHGTIAIDILGGVQQGIWQVPGPGCS